ncbi:aquaporin-like protein [Pavlovales sp. CCMP2436]|nr:aquaporin-like protein [Pavlovales sp. CCMP2436]
MSSLVREADVTSPKPRVGLVSLLRKPTDQITRLTQNVARSAMQASTLDGGSTINSLRREAIGEIIGTFTFLTLGFGVICTASVGGVPIGLGTIAVVWGVGVALGIGISSALSESHLNPAVTLSMVLYRKFELKRAAVYWASQVLGSTLAALLLGIMYLPQVNASVSCELDDLHNPLPFQIGWPGLPNNQRHSAGGIVFFEALAASILVALVFRLDPGNGKPQHLGAAVASLILVFAPLSGAGFNPARDLGPRFASGLLSLQAAPCLAGFGGSDWWPYTLGPMLGAIVGGGIHEIGSKFEKQQVKLNKAKGGEDGYDEFNGGEASATV